MTATSNNTLLTAAIFIVKHLCIIDVFEEYNAVIFFKKYTIEVHKSHWLPSCFVVLYSP